MKLKTIIFLFLLLNSGLGYAQVHISGTGEIVSAGTVYMTLEDDWTNDALGTGFTGSSGTVVLFKGSSQQNINGSKSTTFTGVYLKNSAGLKLNSDITVTGNFDLRGGIVDATSATLLFTSGGKTRYPDNTRHVKGSISRIGTTFFRFDVGSGTKYAPVRISSLNTTGKSATITAEYYKSSAPSGSSVSAPLVKVSDVEYWNISSSASGSESKVEIYWEDGAESGIKSINADSLRFARFDGSNWVDEAATIDAASTLTEGNIETTSAITIDNTNVTFGSTNNIANPLPIQLLSFTAQCQEQNVVINWSTASEENNDYFTILRSEDAEHFEEVATISGAGNSNEVINYRFTDWNAAGSDFYYMLKQTDYDGKSETFAPIFVNCKQSKDVELRVLYDGEQAYAVLNNAQSGSSYNMMIIDYTGRVIVEQKQVVNSKNYYRIPSSQLASGIYSIIYFTDDGASRLTQKFFVR